MDSDDDLIDLCIGGRPSSGVVAHLRGGARAELRPARGPARHTRPATKTRQQQLRRSDSKAVGHQVVAKRALADKDDHSRKLLKMVDGVLTFKGESNTRANAEITYQTAMRVALAPTHLGLYTLQRCLFGDDLSPSVIASARLRVAQCLRIMHKANLDLLTEHWVEAALNASEGRHACASASGPSNSSSSSSSGTRRPVDQVPPEGFRPPEAFLHDDGDVTPGLPAPPSSPGDSSLLQMGELASDVADWPIVVAGGPIDDQDLGMAYVAGVMWKWDGKAIPAYVKERLVAESLGSNGVGLEELNSWVSGKGADCLVQRGCIVTCAPGSVPERIAIPVPPKPLGDKSGRGILAAVEFEATVTRVIESLQKQTFSRGLVGVTPAGKLRSPKIVVVVAICVDAATPNLIAVRIAMGKFNRFNITNTVGIIVLVVLRLCVAHQVHLCGRSVFAAVGGPTDGQTFLKLLTKSCYVFSAAAYIVRIKKAAYAHLAGVKVLSPFEAAIAGVTQASTADCAARVTLMLYLLRWTHQKRKILPDSKLAKAVHFFVHYLNYTWQYIDGGFGECYHICQAGGRCWCKRFRNPRGRLIEAWKLIVAWSPIIFSEGRWSAASPAFAYFALWNLASMLGARALGAAFSKAKLEQTAAQPVQPDSQNEWALDACTKILASMSFNSAACNLQSCLIGVFANESCQTVLFSLFKLESKQHPHMKRFTKKMGRGLDVESSGESHADNEADVKIVSVAPCVKFASGNIVIKQLRTAKRIIAVDDMECAPHIDAFRRLFFAHGVGNDDAKQVVRSVWQCLLPGQAQLWYRTLVLMTDTFPFRLLLLIAPSPTEELKVQVAGDLLDALPCCLDDMCSQQLATMARATATSREGQIEYLLSENVSRIIHVFSETESLTVFDLECVNNIVGKVRVSGRCPDFCTAAAKVYIRECGYNFERVHGHRPYDAFQAAQVAVKELSVSLQKTKHGPSKGRATGYGLFCKDMASLYKDDLYKGDNAGDAKTSLFWEDTIRAQWTPLPQHEKLAWKRKADDYNSQSERAHDAREKHPVRPPVRAGSASDVLLVGDTSTILTDREYALCRQLATWDAHKSQWRFLFRMP